MKKILYSIIILTFFTECSNKTETKNDVILNYDERLLSKKMIPLNDSIFFQTPIGWKELDRTTIQLLDSTIYNNENNVLGGFQSEDEKSFLLYLGELKDQLAQDSTDAKSGKWLAIQYSEFEHNKLQLSQTVLQSSSLVLFKVNAKNFDKSSPILGLHFFIDRNQINSHAMLVESSIASLSLKK